MLSGRSITFSRCCCGSASVHCRGRGNPMCLSGPARTGGPGSSLGQLPVFTAGPAGQIYSQGPTVRRRASARRRWRRRSPAGPPAGGPLSRPVDHISRFRKCRDRAHEPATTAGVTAHHSYPDCGSDRRYLVFNNGSSHSHVPDSATSRSWRAINSESDRDYHRMI